jgi:hypothetical protein
MNVEVAATHQNKKGAMITHDAFIATTKFVVGRAGFEPATNGLKVAGRNTKTLTFKDLQGLPSSTVKVTQRVRIDSCRTVRHKCVTPDRLWVMPKSRVRSGTPQRYGFKDVMLKSTAVWQ